MSLTWSRNVLAKLCSQYPIIANFSQRCARGKQRMPMT